MRRATAADTGGGGGAAGGTDGGRDEDRSAASREEHVRYYRSLNAVIAGAEEELAAEADGRLARHLRDRIDAVNRDKRRIEGMFPEVDWDGVG